MKVSYNWLREFIPFDEEPEELGEILTQTGLEVEQIEKIEKIPGSLKGIVIGEVIECVRHPNADKLKVTKVDIGAEKLSDIVCGAPNVVAGQKVLVAAINSTIHPTAGEPFKVKKVKIRGEVSEGMICAEDEVGLGASHEGIMVLDTAKPNGTPAIELFETEEDHIIEIGLTPNRGDAASHLGVARDLKAYLRKDLTLPKAKDVEIKIKRPISIKIEAGRACPRYAGITIRDVKVKASPDWLQWKLRSIGLEPINNVVDITNYCLHALGQPMHAFDADEIKGDEVLVKMLPAGTKFTTLDDKERELHQDDLMICDGESNGMCMAGVFGGLKSGVKETTQNIFLEVAYFSADAIRATAQRHGLSTGASFRYERGADPEITVYALKLAASMILDIAGGYAASEITDVYPIPVKHKQISTTFHNFHRLVGKKLSNHLILEILNWLEIKTKNVDNEGFVAVVPPYRSDVTRPADLVEEVLRIYGFNSIELNDSGSTDYLAEFNEYEPYRVQQDLSGYLAGKGYSEMLTNSLTNPDYRKEFPIGGEAVEMLNPSSEDLTIMKTSPVYTALEAVAYNINRRNSNLKFFEFGKSYEKKEGGYKETEWLTCCLTGNLTEANWMDETRKVLFQDLSTTIISMLQYAGIRNAELIPSEEEVLYDYGVVVKHKGKEIGSVGKLKMKLLDIYHIKQEVFQAQLHFETLLKKYKTDVAFEPISKYPEVRRDLSLVLDKEVSYADIRQLAFRQEKKLLKRINLFSVYEGDKIEKEKRAYAVSFFLQDKFKTLTDKQIDKSMNELMNLYQQKLGAIIRK
ncbi:MAG: phenylalanine--tRNA ligase subunit beta [Ekhidna sp.]|nr:phenylalanine--tRNA ligase subunit beta [Ekhidna sp.]